MSELSRYCGRCRNLQPSCRCTEGFLRYYSQPATVREAYANLRTACADLEDLIAQGQTADDLHHLDKAVTVMKVGFKMVKRVLRSQGATGNLKQPQESPGETVQ